MKYVLATFLKLKAKALSVTVVRLMWCNMNYKTLNSSSTGGVLYKIETEEILLKGSKLIFQQGKESRFESTNADAWLLYNKKTRNFSMSEGWNAQLSLPAK
jgi:hypothetical protein